MSSTGGFIGQVWDTLWGGVVSIVTYFESLVEVTVNIAVADLNSAISTSMYYAGWYGIFGLAVFAAVIGLTFMGTYFALAAGDALKAVVEE